MIGPQGPPGPQGIPGEQGTQTDTGPTFYVTGFISDQRITILEGRRYPAIEFTAAPDNPLDIDGLHIHPNYSIVSPDGILYPPTVSLYVNSLIELPLPVSELNRYKFTATLNRLNIIEDDNAFLVRHILAFMVIPLILMAILTAEFY